MNKAKRMICLDIIRVYACLSVVAVHLALVFNIEGRIGSIMRAGSSGLFIFYVLSGFVIFSSLEQSGLSYWGWLKKRLIRIFPLYYFMVIACMILFEIKVNLFPQEKTFLYWLSYFLCLPKVLKYSNTFWNNVGTLSSISVFMWFYILAPLLKKIVNNWKKSGLFLIVAFGLYKVFASAQWFSILNTLVYFAIGIFIFYAIKEERENQTLGILLSVVVVMLLADARGGALYCICVGMLIMCTVNVEIKSETVNKIVRFLSDRTFAIYLAHVFVLDISIYTDTFSRFGTSWSLFGILFICTVLGIFVLHEIVEKGSVKLINKLKK